MAVLKDKKFALQMRAQMIAMTKDKIIQARIADGNEGNYSTDHTPDWISMRNAGSRYSDFAGLGGGGYDSFGSSYDSCSFSDGSSY